MADSDDVVFDEALQRATREFARQENASMTKHPSDQEMLNYQEGRLDTEQSQAVYLHLSRCPECADALLELEGWDVAVPEDLTAFPVPLSMPARRRAFEEGLAVRQAPEGQAARQWRVPPSLAAGLAAATLVLGFLLGGLGLGDQGSDAKRTLARLDRPFFTDLVPDGATPRRDIRDPEVRVPAGMNPLILRLNLGDQTLHETYRAELVAASGQTVWDQQDLVRQPAGSFAVLINLGEINSGAYRLIVFGKGTDEETQLAVYSFGLSRIPSS